MISLLASCLANDEAQDVMEYALLVAFVAVAVAGLVMNIGQSVSAITSTSNSQLTAADAKLH